MDLRKEQQAQQAGDAAAAAPEGAATPAQ